jgi:hypothetical protein
LVPETFFSVAPQLVQGATIASKTSIVGLTDLGERGPALTE